MWSAGIPRVPITDAKGLRLWRETFYLRGTTAKLIWLLISSVLYIAFFILVRETLHPEALEPHLDSYGLLVWLALAFVATVITVCILVRVARAIRTSLLTRS